MYFSKAGRELWRIRQLAISLITSAKQKKYLETYV
jgi:hypothetical protein